MNAWSYALKLLSRQDYTEKKLSESLSKKGFSPDEIAEALQDLISEGIVDDKRYALSYIESKKEHYGKKRLEFFLLEKGIAAATIEEVLLTLDRETELSGAVAVAEKKLRVSAPKDTEAKTSEEWYRLRNKLFQALMRAGYFAEIAKQAVEFVLRRD